MENIIESILNAEDLPSPPGVALRLLDLYSQPNVEVDEMAMVIGTDPALTAKLIDYCNSPLLARPRETTNIKQAIVVIGMRAVKILALSFSLVESVSGSQKGSFDYDEFWSQSLATAVIAKTLAGSANQDGDNAFLQGLMLNIGQVGLAHTFPEQYNELVLEAQQTAVPITQLEEQRWSINHLQISTELLRNWHFPAAVVEAPEKLVQLDSGEDTSDDQIRVLRLAQQMVSMLFNPDLTDAEVETNKNLANDWFGLNAESFQELFDQATESWSEFANLLSFDASNAQSFDQLERRALKGITQLSMGLHAENNEMREQVVELKITATIDSLTGLKNRRAYDEEAPAEWERAKRMLRPFVIMMVDIDHFKSVNDTHGHAIGDLALVAVADVLKHNARQYDSVYRFGGEEFVVMLPECEPAAASSAAERYRSALEKLEMRAGQVVLKITASFGVAIHMPGAEGSMEALLEEADQLLYEAKKTGRNRVCTNNIDCPPTQIPAAILKSHGHHPLNIPETNSDGTV